MRKQNQQLSQEQTAWRFKHRPYIGMMQDRLKRRETGAVMVIPRDWESRSPWEAPTPEAIPSNVVFLSQCRRKSGDE